MLPRAVRMTSELVCSLRLELRYYVALDRRHFFTSSLWRSRFGVKKYMQIAGLKDYFPKAAGFGNTGGVKSTKL